MKIGRIILTGLLLLLLVVPAVAADNYMIVKQIIGKANYAVPGQQPKPIMAAGMRLQQGIRITTGAGALLKLGYPGDNGTVVTLRENTTANVTALITSGGKYKSSFNLRTGRMRAIVSGMFGTDFQVRTRNAVAGVRGTDFGVSYNEGSDAADVMVFKGLVAVGGDGVPTQLVKPGFKARVVNRRLVQKRLTQADLRRFDNVKVDQPADDGGKTTDKTTDNNTATPGDTTVPSGSTKDPGRSSGGSSGSSGFGFGGGIGPEVIGDKTWTKMLLTPKFSIGKFKMALYIPIYYDPNDGQIWETSRWYNSDEWDFTSVKDFIHDFLLKFQYVQYGEKKPGSMREKLFFKLGSIDDFELGHGFVMRNYSNMENFPDIRRIGFQFDMDFKAFGFETMMADIYRADIFGARFYVKPGKGRLAFGLSHITDIHPDGDDNNFPVVWTSSLDVEYTLPSLGILTWKVFADVAKQGYSVHGTYTNYGVNATDVGPKYTDGLGMTYGVMGRVLFFDYRLAYRYLKNGFMPEYFDSYYETLRGQRAAMLISGAREDYQGWIFEMGLDLGKIGRFALNFQEYYGKTAGSDADQNKLKVELSLHKGVIPKFRADFLYERYNTSVKGIFDDFFDANTVATAKLYYEVAEGVEMVATYRRYYDEAGVAQNTYAVETQFGI